MANAVRTTGGIGARLDIAVRRGMPMTPYELTLWEDDEGTVLFDLTGYTINAAVRTRATSVRLDGGVSTVIEPFTVPMSHEVTGPGAVALTMPAASIDSLIAAGAAEDVTVVCDWGFSLSSSTGEVAPVFFGEFEVHPAMPGVTA